MKIKIDAETLADALSVCASDPKAVISILRGAVFSPIESGLTIIGTDHSAYTTHTIPCTFLDDARESFCIEVLRVLSALSGVTGNIIIDVKKKGVALTDEAQRFNYQIKSFNVQDFPSRIPVESEIETGYDPMAIKRFLPYASGLIDALETNEAIKSLHFEDGYLACLTRNRFVFGSIGGDIDPVLLPRHSAKLLQDILTKESVITIGIVGVVSDTYDRLIVRNESLEVNFVLTHHKPVPWQRICKSTDTSKAHFIFDSSELIAAVNRLAKFVDNKKGLAGVDVSFENNCMTFSVQETGKPIPIHEKVNCEVEGDPTDDRVNLSHLYQTVNRMNKSNKITWHQWPTKQEGTAFVNGDESVYFKLSCLN